MKDIHNQKIADASLIFSNFYSTEESHPLKKSRPLKKAPRYFLWVNQEVPEKSVGFQVEFSADVHHRDTEAQRAFIII